MNNLERRMLNAIGLFEGSRGGGINTWDEQLLSLGTLHYAVGQGSGLSFLQRVYQLDPAGFLACLGRDFTEAVRGGPGSTLAFCRAAVWRTGPRWNQAFAALSRLPAYEQADVEHAAPYLKGARALAMRYGLHSERGLFWCLDRCVQQGPKPRPAVDAAFRRLPKGTSEQGIMEALAVAYANTANFRYRQTVLRRSLTAARGDSAGTGYPGRVNLERDFQISLSRPWAKREGLPTVFYRVTEGGVVRNVKWDGKPLPGPYGGEIINAEWVARYAALYGPGSAAVIGRCKLTVYPDGSFQLDKVIGN